MKLKSFNELKVFSSKHIRTLGSRFTKRQYVRDYIFNKYPQCLKCGTKENLTLDHIKPLIKGGLNTLDNLQTLCGYCNSKKGKKEIDYRNTI
jgi:5-methylcytosine-specific restriction endonuclease McrA